MFRSEKLCQRLQCRAVRDRGGGLRSAAKIRVREGVERLLGALLELPDDRQALGLLRGWPSPEFDHPLVRAAVLDDLSPSERAALHERAAKLAMVAGEAQPHVPPSVTARVFPSGERRA